MIVKSWEASNKEKIVKFNGTTQEYEQMIEAIEAVLKMIRIDTAPSVIKSLTFLIQAFKVNGKGGGK